MHSGLNERSTQLGRRRSSTSTWRACARSRTNGLFLRQKLVDSHVVASELGGIVSDLSHKRTVVNRQIVDEVRVEPRMREQVVDEARQPVESRDTPPHHPVVAPFLTQPGAVSNCAK